MNGKQRLLKGRINTFKNQKRNLNALETVWQQYEATRTTNQTGANKMFLTAALRLTSGTGGKKVLVTLYMFSVSTWMLTLLKRTSWKLSVLPRGQMSLSPAYAEKVIVFFR